MFKHLSVQEAHSYINTGEPVVVDIRDPQTFAAGHIEGAFHLNNDSLPAFMQQTSKQTPVIVCCYHGISSQQAAQFLVQQGYENVFNLDGGFEAWRQNADFSTGD
ncbi:thiosulfate sulfurtransferase GlpE [Aestuariibacter salexigens]|uniref:thiosulfate sulfurtransferase GlpE n=1 Tax=Aestuariibacter salexigens TaxID=226010 RepID=UPI00041E95A1|nr:thiosulfate sulfurtransferase GlpE [Aestuariibacter salexigens]